MDRALVDIEAVKRYATENKLLYFETSAKTGKNVLELFQKIGEELPEVDGARSPGETGSRAKANSRAFVLEEKVNSSGTTCCR